MITPAAFSIFITTVNTMIGEAYSEQPVLYPEFTTVIPMESEFLTFGWTGMLGQMRVWDGPRVSNEPAPQTYTVGSLPFEYTLTLDRFNLDDDKYGIYYRILPDMAKQARRWEDFQMRNLIEGLAPWTGSFQNGLDGLTNWSTQHPIDLYNANIGTLIGSGPFSSGLYCNDFTGGGQPINGTQIGGAFGVTSFATLYEYMSIFPAEDGESMDVTPNVLMHPAQLKTEVELTLLSNSFAPPAWGTIASQVGAADNPLKRYGVRPLENKLLRSATRWYLMDTTKPMKPFTFGLRQSPIFVQRTNEDDPQVFENHMYTWGDWARGVAAWNYAWLCCRSGS